MSEIMNDKRLRRWKRHVTEKSKGVPYGRCIGQVVTEHFITQSNGKQINVGDTTSYFHVTKGRKSITAGNSHRCRMALALLYMRFRAIHYAK